MKKNVKEETCGIFEVLGAGVEIEIPAKIFLNFANYSGDYFYVAKDDLNVLFALKKVLNTKEIKQIISRMEELKKDEFELRLIA